MTQKGQAEDVEEKVKESSRVDLTAIGMLVTDMITGPVTAELFEQDSMHVKIQTLPGGDAGNVCTNAAALGLRTELVSCVGDDPNGIFLKENLARAGVGTSCVATSKTTPTAVSLVLTEPSGERHFLTSTDIFGEISPLQIPDALLQRTRALSLNSYYRMKLVDGAPAADLFRRAQGYGVRTCVDTMHCRQGDPLQQILPVLAYTDIFLPSYEEARQITGQDTPEEMAEVIRGTGVKIFIVKLGAEGCFVTDFAEHFRCPADETAKVVGTVGAGDTFCAGLIAALQRGMDLHESAAFATCAAACTVEVAGASGGIRSFEEVQDRYERYRKRHPF